MAVAVPSNVLYVGNLPKGTSKATLEGFLQPYGVMRINVREGYGIAEMNSVSEATRAIQQLNGFDFNGSSLAVRFKAQSQHKQGHQFRQLNNHNHQINSNGKGNFQDGPTGKDFNKNLTPTSPPVMNQEPAFGNDLSSPQSAMPAEVRTVQVGLRGLQITTTNNLAQHQQKQINQLEQELKNVAFLPDNEKVRHLEQLIHMQQNKIIKLEARLEEIMEAANKQTLQNGANINRPNMIIPPASIQMQMQAPVSQQQGHNVGNFNHQNLQFSAYYGSQVQQHWPQAYPPPNSFYCDQQQVQSTGYVPPPLMLQASKMGQANGYGICGDAVSGAYIPGAGYPQNIVRVGTEVLSPLQCDAMNNCSFFPPAQVTMPPPAGDFHAQPSRDYKQHDGRQNNVENRFNRNARPQGDTHRGGFGVNNHNNNGQNRALRGNGVAGNNRQNGFGKNNDGDNQQRQHRQANRNAVDAEKAKAAAAAKTDKVKEEQQLSPVENQEPSLKNGNEAALCPRCLKSIPENAVKCPDCRSSNHNEEEAEEESSGEKAEVNGEEKSPECVTAVEEEVAVVEEEATAEATSGQEETAQQ